MATKNRCEHKRTQRTFYFLNTPIPLRRYLEEIDPGEGSGSTMIG